MKKKQLFVLIITLVITLLIPTNIYAKEINENYKYQYEKVEKNNEKYNIKIYNNSIIKSYDPAQNCAGDNSILGNYNDPNSVANLLQKIFDWIKLLGPFLVVVMSGIDFAKVIVMGDDDGMKKAQNKLITRLILALSLFLLPDLIMALLDLFNITSSGLCGLQ